MLTTNDQLKIDIIAKAAANLIPKKVAAKILNKSMATIFRYCASYKEKGALFVIHGNKGRPSPVATDPKKKEEILNLISQKYYDFTIRHAWEKLAEDDLQIVSYKTLLSWCRERNFVKRIKRRVRKQYKARVRMPQRGLMLQMDGSYHKWFGNKKSCLIAAIEDADNDIPYAEFFRWETTLNCMKVIKNIIKKYGIFKVLYVDRAGAFGGMKRTHFSQLEDACSRLGIQVIYANSAQAKGRIERFWRTMQSRLIPELRLRGITDILEANMYLQLDFIPNQYRGKFTFEARSEESAYVAIDPKILQEIFTGKSTRKILSDSTFSWAGKRWLIEDAINLSNGHVEIREYPEGGISFFFRDKKLSVTELERLKNAS